MRDVDYEKLSEQYGTFLIAIGGVSITVLSIVSTLGFTSPTPIPQTLPPEVTVLGIVSILGFPSPIQVPQTPLPDLNQTLFLSAALIVATVCCFIGAHMMAETAAFVKRQKEKAKEEPPEGSPPAVSSWELCLSQASTGASTPVKAEEAVNDPLAEKPKKEELQEGSPAEGTPAEDLPAEGTPTVSKWRVINYLKGVQKDSSVAGNVEWRPSEAIKFGKRLFLFASTNIFIAVILVLFSLVLLQGAREAAKGTAPKVSLIYSIIFLFVGIGTLLWMVLAALFRVPVSKKLIALPFAIIFGVGWSLFLANIPRTRDGVGFWAITEEGLLVITFLPIVLVAVLSFISFAWIFKDGTKACKRTLFKDGYKARTPKVRIIDSCFFGSAVAVSFASLIAAGMRLDALRLFDALRFMFGR